MLRAILYALISIVAITFLRMVIGLVTKAMADMFRQETASGQRPQTPSSGELKACAVCGTYVLASKALVMSRQGKTLYYCSERCRAGAASAS